MSVLEMKEGNIARLTITVEKDAFVKALNDAYHKTAGRYPVPGFRKGKAPRKVIETNYGAMVFYDEAFDLCWAEPYDAAIREHDLTPVDRPSVVDIPKMSEAEGVTYVAEVQLKPEVTLGQYKGIAVKKLAYTVTDEEVDEALKMEQQKQVRYEDVDRPVENGDRIILDYCGKVDGVAFEGGTAEDQTLDIGSGTFIPGFEEQLVGVNPGEEKDIHVTFPEEYHAENLKGKPAVFTCKEEGAARDRRRVHQGHLRAGHRGRVEGSQEEGAAGSPREGGQERPGERAPREGRGQRHRGHPRLHGGSGGPVHDAELRLPAGGLRP